MTSFYLQYPERVQQVGDPLMQMGGRLRVNGLGAGTTRSSVSFIKSKRKRSRGNKLKLHLRLLVLLLCLLIRLDSRWLKVAEEVA